MNKPKKLRISIALLVVLSLCFCVTSFALAYAVLRVDSNVFQTGHIDIDLNGGQPVIAEDEFLFEPGMTVKKDCYIQNNGSWAVYYKLYFTNVEGALGDILDVTIRGADGQVPVSYTHLDVYKRQILVYIREFLAKECESHLYRLCHSVIVG